MTCSCCYAAGLSLTGSLAALTTIRVNNPQPYVVLRNIQYVTEACLLGGHPSRIRPGNKAGSSKFCFGNWEAALADSVMFVNLIITSIVYKQGDCVWLGVRPPNVYRLCVPRSFHRKYVDNSFYSWVKTRPCLSCRGRGGRVSHTGATHARASPVIFSCSEADELRMLDQRRTISDNVTAGKEWEWILCIVSR